MTGYQEYSQNHKGMCYILQEGHQFNIRYLFITLEVKNYKHLEKIKLGAYKKS